MSALTWAFWSPRRLGTVAGGGMLALVAGIGAVSQALSPGGHDAAPVFATQSVAPVAPAVADPGPDPALDPEEERHVYGPDAADADAVQAARGFVRAWLRGPHVETAKAWHASLRPYVTTELLAGLRRTDRDRVPRARQSEDAPLVRALGEYVTELTVRLSGGREVHVTVAYDGSLWRVADVDDPSGR